MDGTGYPMTCLDLAQFVVHVMLARVQPDKLPGMLSSVPVTVDHGLFWYVVKRDD